MLNGPGQAVSGLSISEDCRLLSTVLCLDADSMLIMLDVDRQMLMIYRPHEGEKMGKRCHAQLHSASGGCGIEDA